MFIKHTIKASILLVIIILSSCNQVNNNTTNSEQNTSAVFKKEFPEYGFEIETTFEMKDVSNQASGDFLLNLGGIENENDNNSIGFYQLILTRVPIGYKDFSKSKYERKVDELIKSKIQKFDNVKSIKFSYNEYPGYEMYTTNKGMTLKGVIFYKDNYIISLNLTTNYNLEERFNKFSNSIKFIGSDLNRKKLNKNNERDSNAIVNNTMIKSDILKLTVSAPCKFNRSSQATNDYAYIGLINENDQSKAIVYKVEISIMPMPYAQMGNYDKRTIKNNIKNMSSGYSNFSGLKLNTSCDFAYKYSTVESGFNMYHAIIMKGKYLYEFIIFSKLDISNEVTRFYNSIK